MKKEFLKYGIELTDKQERQFRKYYDLLFRWNEKINLTAITEYDMVVRKHFIDSALLVKCEKYKHNKINKVLDLGTGAGFPGIPIKIAFPYLEITLLDSLNKRVSFLNQVIDSLGLEKIAAVHGRAEDFAKKELYREKFDVCVSRAVANLSSLSELCLPYVKVGGKFISYKSEKAMEELVLSQNAISLLGGGNVSCDAFTLPGADLQRTFIIIQKVKETPLKYPRKAGIPIKRPL